MKPNGKRQTISRMISRLRDKAPKPDDYLRFSSATSDIEQALCISNEAAAMTLYGLCATGNVRVFNGQYEVIDVEKCVMEDFERIKPIFVSRDDVRHWLTEWSRGPVRRDRDKVILTMVREGLVPGRNISWKKFCVEVRNKCNGWGAKDKPATGFGDKQIQRAVKGLQSL
jgi:hypothetical protein